MNYISEGATETQQVRITKAVSIFDKLERQNTIDALEKEVIDLVDKANFVTGEKYETMQEHVLAVTEAKEVLEQVWTVCLVQILLP